MIVEWLLFVCFWSRRRKIVYNYVFCFGIPNFLSTLSGWRVWIRKDFSSSSPALKGPKGEKIILVSKLSFKRELITIINFVIEIVFFFLFAFDDFDGGKTEAYLERTQNYRMRAKVIKE